MKIENETIAGVVGLPDLSLGPRRLLSAAEEKLLEDTMSKGARDRDEKQLMSELLEKKNQEQVYLSRYWIIRINPSFATAGALATLTAERGNTWERRGNEWTKTVLIVHERDSTCWQASDVENDSIAEIFRRLDLYPAEDQGADDGIAYEIEIQLQNEISARIELDNPNSPAMKELERAIFMRAHELSQLSNDERLKRAVEEWRSYMTPSPR